MSTSTTEKVGVVGCGLMGAGIAETCARSGFSVTVVETTTAAADAGRRRLETSLTKAEARGKVASAAEILDRIQIVEDVDALADRSLVIEAIMEDEGAKTALFRRLDAVVADPEAILASNTSSIPIIKLGVVTERPQNVMGIHFFNPVPVLSLVELVPSYLTAQTTTERARTFAQALGKHPIDCKDRAGFVVNALLIPFLLAAIRMVEQGVATPEDIDEGLVRGCAHPQGPLALSDLIGLDTVRAIADSLYEEFKEPQYACPPMLARMVDAGLLGRKSGRGFFDYSTRSRQP
ncbi:3-hydroxybutyryl-CoA dehydrogenase [Mycobacterium sp. NAZ190054]|uniref:3-hydroxybutyryl-CoA dehydrogenase n=1 Tax=Mycobacterium sp. NAZ190054 TaxID=1747766 RepID=UPI0007959427|nr:3-hydroxybutyryl-CoA dehydrogenase [Mycobacterium sp. NAZ190054]KWX68412.1 3-hydroxybutyryl-CoA dehydrogenase [Mycobacterium sp. NAZ190054]